MCPVGSTSKRRTDVLEWLIIWMVLVGIVIPALFALVGMIAEEWGAPEGSK